MSTHTPTRQAAGAAIAALVPFLLFAAVATPAHGASLTEHARVDKPAYKSARATVAKARKMRKYRYGTRPLRMGAIGADVVKLQKYLNGLAFPTTVDGAFGPGTKKSVVGFERSRSAKVDGVVAKKQAKKIRRAAKKRRVPASGFVFPVPGPHSYGGAGSVFGAPRNGHIHQGQDVAAACGSPLIAAQGGTVRVNAYQASGAGYYVVIRGATNGEDYAYMHMTAKSIYTVGTVVPTGLQIGTVGATGSATGCHLHFEMWTVPGWRTGGYPYDPKPSLQLWDAYS